MHETLDSQYAHVVATPGKGPADALVLGTGMHVWEIAWTARHYDTVEAMAEGLKLDRALLEEGMRFAEAYPDEVAAAVAENDAVTLEDLRALFPGLTVFTFENCPTNDDAV